MKTSDLLRRVDELIAQGDKTLQTRRQGGIVEAVDDGMMHGFRSAALSFIDRVYTSTHPHFILFSKAVQGAQPVHVSRGVAILQSIRSEIADGWLFSIKGLITAEVFTDFLEMAEHLLDSGYKDAAAVMAGSVLEEHLRQLCRREGIDTEEEKDEKLVAIKTDRLNSELAKSEVYSKLDQKQITAWLDLRNKAAHGKYEEYNLEQVRQLILGSTEFMARVAL